jgi:hypothetical protein
MQTIIMFLKVYNNSASLKQVLLVSFIFLSFASFSQDVKMGIKAGGNIANIKGDFGNDFESQPKFGIHTGVFFDFKSKKVFSVLWEFNYSQKGYQSDIIRQSKIIHNINYLDVPLLAKFTFEGGTGFHFGPQFSVLLSSRLKQGDRKDYTSSEGINDGSVSLCFGINQEIGALIDIGARYNYGLSKVMISKNDLTSPDRVLQLYVSLGVTPKRKK